MSITNIENLEHLTFNYNGKVCFINALRRTILSKIPCACFITSPEKDNKLIFIKNTCGLNNEIIKQRFSNIPIHITNLDEKILDNLEVQLNVKNDTNTLIDVTTGDFKIYDKISENYLPDSDVHKLFPANDITGDYILICKLKPQISDDILGEEINCKGTISVSNASNLGCYNVAHTCTYKFKKDISQQEQIWETVKDKHIVEGDSEKTIMDKKKNWMLGDGTKIVIPDSFNFTLESLGVYSNIEIIKIAFDIIIKDFQKCIEKNDYNITKSTTIMKNAFDMEIEHDYSFGYIIQYIMLESFYEKEKLLSYVGFKKLHPHDDTSVLKIAFISNDSTKETFLSLFKRGCELAVVMLKDLDSKFV